MKVIIIKFFAAIIMAFVIVLLMTEQAGLMETCPGKNSTH